jgi:hypothetical protein
MRLRSVVVLLGALGVLVAGCKSKRTAGPFGSASVARAGLVEAGAPVPAGDLHALYFRYALAVFSTPDAKKVDADAIVRASVEGKGMDVRTEIPQEPPGKRILIIQHPGVHEYAPPSTDNLQYFARGLSDAQKAMLPKATDVTLLLFGGPAADAVATYPIAAEAAAALTRATGGVVYDDATRLAFGVGAWQKTLDGWKDGGADVPRTTIIHEYQDGELLRLVTLGMAKYGLPDVSVKQVTNPALRRSARRLAVLLLAASACEKAPRRLLKLAKSATRHILVGASSLEPWQVHLQIIFKRPPWIAPADLATRIEPPVDARRATRAVLDDLLARADDVPRAFRAPSEDQLRRGVAMIRALKIRPDRPGGGWVTPYGAAKRFAQCFDCDTFPRKETEARPRVRRRATSTKDRAPK